MVANVLVAIAFFSSSHMVARDLSRVEDNMLWFPSSIPAPKHVVLYKEVRVYAEKDDDEMTLVAFSPIASYSIGYIRGWQKCCKDIGKDGYGCDLLNAHENC